MTGSGMISTPGLTHQQLYKTSRYRIATDGGFSVRFGYREMLVTQPERLGGAVLGAGLTKLNSPGRELQIGAVGGNR